MIYLCIPLLITVHLFVEWVEKKVSCCIALTINLDLCARSHLNSVSCPIQCSRVESDTVIQEPERTSTLTRTRRSSARVSRGNRFVLASCYHQHHFFCITSHLTIYCNLVVKSRLFFSLSLCLCLSLCHTHTPTSTPPPHTLTLSFLVWITSSFMSKITREIDS